MESGMSVTVGVDTHADAHVGVALDHLGHRLGEIVVHNEAAGYSRLLGWALNLGELACVGVEGTGSFGAGLSRFLRSQGVRVVEVNRTSRQSTVVGPASMTLLTQKLPRGLFFLGLQPKSRKPLTDRCR